MDLQDRLKQLENVRDWQGLVEELEKGIQSQSAHDNEAKASFHLRLGQVLEQKFLAGVKALKHFQDAYKLNPALGESLEAARSVYWALGKLNMVQKLLELELRTHKDGPQASALLIELGDVLCDLGDYDKATSTYARALTTSNGQSVEARACLEDVQAESGSWQTHVSQLSRAVAAESDPAAKSRLFLRAARITRRFAPDDVLGMLEQAYSADPSSKQAAALYEGMMGEAGKLEQLEQIQSKLLLGEANKKMRAKTAHVFGTRWVSRHQNVDTGAKFLEESIKLDPENEGAFHYLRDAYGRKGGDWDRVLTLAEEAVTHSGENGNATFLLAQAGTIAWRQLGNLIRARTVFERLSHIEPQHPMLLAFEAQIGEQLSNMPPAMSGIPPIGTIPPAGGVAKDTRPPPPVLDTTPPPVNFDPKRASIPDDDGVTAPPAAPERTPAAPAVASSSAADAHQSVTGTPAKIAELRALADKQEANKRYNEYVKTLLQLAAMVPDADEKVSLYTKAAELYTGKFANQAEAVKAYEAVIAIDPENRGAIDYLRGMYEKRRDWEKLLGLERREAERLFGDERAGKFLEIAKLATERVKKPEVCIELWHEVLNSDPANGEALGALGGLYERSKDFDKLVEVLEKQAEVTYDNGQKIQILTKLGTIYGDRLNNDEGAVTAWRSLLTIDPNDRKAQEALKKKYLTLGRWDDLEVFYAESGKWDEFIRVLEQQEAKDDRTRDLMPQCHRVRGKVPPRHAWVVHSQTDHLGVGKTEPTCVLSDQQLFVAGLRHIHDFRIAFQPHIFQPGAVQVPAQHGFRQGFVRMPIAIQFRLTHCHLSLSRADLLLSIMFVRPRVDAGNVFFRQEVRSAERIRSGEDPGRLYVHGRDRLNIFHRLACGDETVILHQNGFRPLSILLMELLHPLLQMLRQGNPGIGILHVTGRDTAANDLIREKPS